MPRILEGIIVLDLGTGPASALATMFLGDQGARVIRVVTPGQPHLREGGFVVWDRGKECVALDLDAAATGSGAADFERLVRGADILVEDFAPSAPLQKLVDWQRLKRINPRLISCSITAYGKRGPWKDEPPIEDLVMARVGLLSGMPGFRPAPVHVVHPLPSVGAALMAASGIAAALLARETTGRGRALETSLMAGTLLYQTKATGEKLAPHVFQTNPSGSAPFYSNYECADGKWVQLGCVHVAFVATAAKLFGIGDMIKEPRFGNGTAPQTPKDDAELRATLARIMRTRSSHDWAEVFEAADVPFAPARDSEEGLSDPQVLHNKMVVTLDDPLVGPLTQMGVPIHFTETPGKVSAARAAKAVVAKDVAIDAGHAATVATTGDDAPPLAGVRILEITNLIAGPTTGRILADLGADVIKLEPPAGDMSRPIGRTYFYAVNFNKRSVCVDTSTDEGKKVVQRIAASADALVANLRPQATARMGIGPKINPRLIETHLTGYGWTGPYSKRPGIDPLAQAYMGLQRAQGGPDNPPVFPAQLAPTDYTTGAMGALGTILALYARARTGVVQRVESNLLSGGIVLSSAWFTKYAGKPVRPLADKDQFGPSPFHRLFKLADGWIYVVADSAAQKTALAKVAGVAMPDAGALSPKGIHPNATPFAKALTDAFASRKVDETLKALNAAGVPCAPSPRGDADVFLDEPHTIASDMVAVRNHAKAGKMRVAWQQIQFAETKPSAGLSTPLLGEHTAAVLSEVGYGDAEIAGLHAKGTVITEKV